MMSAFSAGRLRGWIDSGGGGTAGSLEWRFEGAVDVRFEGSGRARGTAVVSAEADMISKLCEGQPLQSDLKAEQKVTNDERNGGETFGRGYAPV